MKARYPTRPTKNIEIATVNPSLSLGIFQNRYSFSSGGASASSGGGATSSARGASSSGSVISTSSFTGGRTSTSTASSLVPIAK